MPDVFKISFSENAFVAAIVGELATPGITPLAAASRFFGASLLSSLREAVGSRLIKDPAISKGTWPARYETLEKLARTGTEAWYPELRFSTRPGDAVEGIIPEPEGFRLEPIDYGFGLERFHQLKVRRLKTQANHELRLNHVVFPAALFALVADKLKAGPPPSQPYIANPEPHGSARRMDTSLPGFRTVAFDHVLDGTRLFCECARSAHARMRAEASERALGYAPDSWPQRTMDLLASPSYREGICHLCLSDRDGPETAALAYGDNVQHFEDVYIDQLVREGSDDRTARAEVQRRLGLSRWKSEAALYQIVKAILPDALIQREASPPWLGRQRLDIFLPTLNLAIEYQGAQHFTPVSVFGGEAGLARARERDALKKRLCEENGVHLMYVLSTDAVTEPALKRRLQRFMKATS